MKTQIYYFFIIIFIFTAIPSPVSGNEKIKTDNKGQINSSNIKESEDLLKRIDFGNSYIKGQSIKSGAVYLLQRKKSEIKSMLQYRTDYRQEILEGFQFKGTDQ
jgi:hypothetical protein